MKKRISALIMAVLLLALAACGTNSTADEGAQQEAEQETSSADDAVASDETAAPADTTEPKESAGSDVLVMSDELTDFTFTLDGVVYQLPCAYTELADNGWTILDAGVYETDKIGGNDYIEFGMEKGENRIRIILINMSGNAKILTDCKVGAIEVARGWISDASVFSIAKGITTEFSADDITSAFGIADFTKDDEYYTELQYIYGEEVELGAGFGELYSGKAEFWCSKEKTEENGIVLHNCISDESDATETSVEVPSYLADYVSPTELDSDPTSMTVEFCGDLYTLPAPVSVFLDNGWTITSTKPSKIASYGKEEMLEIERGEEKAYIDIYNFADYQTIPENCAVCYLSVNTFNGEQSITLSGGIALGSTREDVEALVTSDFEYSKSAYNDEETWHFGGDGGESIHIYTDPETGKVDHIFVQSGTWAY